MNVSSSHSYQTPTRLTFRNESRSSTNTVNTGRGREEKRLQLWRPEPLQLATMSVSSQVYTGQQPIRREEMADSPKPASFESPKLPFKGESSTRSDYLGFWEIPKTPPFSPQQQIYKHPGPSPEKISLPLTGQSTNQSVYQAYSPEQLRSLRPSALDSNMQPSRGGSLVPFSGESTTRSTFVAPPTPSSSSFQQPPRSQQDHPKKIDFVGQSTTRSAYQPIDQEFYLRQSPCPPRVDVAPSLPLTGQSTTRSQFIEPSRENRIEFPQQESVSRRSLPLSGESTTRSSYLGKQLDDDEAPIVSRNKALFYGDTRQAQVSPKLPFKGSSTMRTDYPGHIPTTEDQGKMTPPSPMTKIPFKGASTQHEDFPGHIPPPRQSPIKTIGEEFRKRLPLSSETESGRQFVGWKLPEKRPALGIELYDDLFFEMLPESQEGDILKITHIFTTCADEQHTVEVKILEAPRGRVEPIPASECKLLAVFELVGIPPCPAAIPQIAVTFTVNEKSVLHVSAEDRNSGKKTHIAVDRLRNSSAFQ